MRLRALVRTRADKVCLGVGGAMLLALSVLALSGSSLAAGMLVMAAGLLAGLWGGALVIRRSRRKRLVAGSLLLAGLIAPFVGYLLTDAESGLGPTPLTLIRGFSFGLCLPAFGRLAGLEPWSYWSEPPHDGGGGSSGAERAPRAPSSRREALSREFYREPNLFRRLFALPLLAFSVLAIYAGVGGLLESGSLADALENSGASVLTLMGAAFLMSNVAELLPNGLAKPRAVLRGAGFAAFLLLMVSIAAYALVALLTDGSVLTA